MFAVGDHSTAFNYIYNEKIGFTQEKRNIRKEELEAVMLPL